jgi:hypothetical protein
MDSVEVAAAEEEEEEEEKESPKTAIRVTSLNPT